MGFILQKVEESYTILCQRLAGSALTDKHSGMWKVWDPKAKTPLA